MYLFVPSFTQQVLPENSSFKKSDHIIPCSESSPVSAKNLNYLPPEASAHSTLPPQGLCIYCSFCLECSSLIVPCLALSCLGGLSKKVPPRPPWLQIPLHPTLATTLHYFILFPSTLCYMSSSWVREHISLATVSFLPWTEPERGEH